MGKSGGGGSLGAGADVEGDELVDVLEEAVHVVVVVGVDGDEDALVVVGGDDQQPVADDGVAALLRLVADDQQLGADLPGKIVEAGGAGLAAPDELVDRAGAAFVVGAGGGGVEDRVVEVFELVVGGQAV